MPTNLPPEYFDIEKRYRAAEALDEKISTLEELISSVPKHKGTDKLRADLRTRLSKLKSSAQAQKKTGKYESMYSIDKEGAGQVVVIGSSNVGKSALVAALTNAEPEVSEYPYTTRAPMPGMLLVDSVQIQLIDTPPLDRDYIEPELMNLIKRADLILLVLDLLTYPIQQLEETIALLNQHRIVPSPSKQKYVEDRVFFIPLWVVVNKSDDEETEELFEIFCGLLESDWACVPVSARTGRNLEQLKRVVLDSMDVIRVYAKPPGKEADLSTPFVMKKGGTVEDFAVKIHKDFYKNLKSARVWGSGAFDGQMVGREHILQDGDVVELRV